MRVMLTEAEARSEEGSRAEFRVLPRQPFAALPDTPGSTPPLEG